MFEIVLKSLFVGIAVLLAVPFVGWLERALRIARGPSDAAALSPLLGPGRVIQPLVDALKRASKQELLPANGRVAHTLAPVLALVLLLGAFAVVPIAGRHTLGDMQFSGIAADVDWGLLYVIAVIIATTYVPLLAARSVSGAAAMQSALRSISQTLAALLPLSLSGVGLFIVFGSLRLSDMVVAQDATCRALVFVAAVGGLDPTPGWVEGLRLPAWGIFLQPLSFAVFFPAVLVACRRAPFDLNPGLDQGLDQGLGLGGGYKSRYSGIRLGLFALAEHVQTVLIASLVVCLFLGGWAIPYLSQGELVDAVASLFGDGFALGLAVAVQLGVFIAKWVVVIAVMVLLRGAVAWPRGEQLFGLCWKVLLPLALFNVFATAAGLLWLRSVGLEGGT